MRDQVHLALAADTLTLCWVQAPPRRGWLARLRRRVSPATPPAQSRTVQAAFDSLNELAGALEQAWSSLRKQVPAGLDAADFLVQLGLTHARLGLLHQVQDGHPATAAAVIERYVRAWVQQMWRLDPASLIVRWQRLGHGPTLLISCIDFAVYSLLEAFTQRHRLRFVSCKPAVLSALELSPSATGSGAAPRILVWTEPSAVAARSPLVQLIHCAHAQPHALWRGWLPARDQATTSDEALQGAIRRFCAAYAPDTHVPLVLRHWDHSMPPQESSRANP
jgi:hypothetical protein